MSGGIVLFDIERVPLTASRRAAAFDDQAVLHAPVKDAGFLVIEEIVVPGQVTQVDFLRAVRLDIRLRPRLCRILNAREILVRKGPGHIARGKILREDRSPREAGEKDKARDQAQPASRAGHVRKSGKGHG
nr:hypothetical protein [uncultured Gellertiella sp.]